MWNFRLTVRGNTRACLVDSFASKGVPNLVVRRLELLTILVSGKNNFDEIGPFESKKGEASVVYFIVKATHLR